MCPPSRQGSVNSGGSGKHRKVTRCGTIEVVEPPSPEVPSLEEFCRALGRLRRSCGRPTLEALARVPGARRKSALGEIFSGGGPLPPDRDVVAVLVENLLARERQGRLPPGLPDTTQGWLDLFDAVVLRWEREHLDAVAVGDLPDITRPFMVRAKSGFVGRSAELARLNGLLADSREGPQRPVVISALAGTAGVGKTALAERWADLAEASFPDGVLYVNLRGYDARQRMKPRDAAALFLRELGIRRNRIPYGHSDRMALLARALEGRSVLVVYDNAADSEHVRPLLLGQPGCFTIVTSRDSMQDLVADDGAVRIELDRLTSDQAVELLTVHIDAAVQIGDRELVDLAEACVRLPLALRIAADTLNKFPQRPVAELLADLRDEQRKLDVFDRRDPDRALRSLFSWSYAYLTDDEAAMFRAVGVHPGSGQVDPHSVAAVLDLPAYTARRRLDMLCRSYLVESRTEGRYEMHDLLRTYARELAEELDPAPKRRDGVARLTDYYLFTTSRAMDVIAPYERSRRPTIPSPAADIPEFPSPDAARAWLRAERGNLMSTAQVSLGTTSSESVVTLSLLVFRFLDSQALYDVAMTLHGQAVEVLRQRGDRVALGMALRHLGVTQERVGQNEAAAMSLAEALELARLGDDPSLICYNLNSLGLICYRLGRNREAITLLDEAIALAESLDDGELLGTACRNVSFAHWRLGEYAAASVAVERANEIARGVGDETLLAFTLTNLGLTYWRTGRVEEALECQREALETAEAAGAEVVAGYATTNLGLVLWRIGRFAEALEQQEKAMVRVRDVAHLSLRAYVTMNLGLACWKVGDLPRAMDCLTTASTLAQQIRDMGVATEALNGLGEVARAAGHRDTALRCHERALAAAEETGDRFERARAAEGIGRWHADRQDPRAAELWLGRSHAEYTDLRDAQADVVGDLLRRAGAAQDP